MYENNCRKHGITFRNSDSCPLCGIEGLISNLTKRVEYLETNNVRYADGRFIFEGNSKSVKKLIDAPSEDNCCECDEYDELEAER